MAEILSKISVVSFIVAVVSFATAVTLFFVFKIPNVIGDLSGKNAQRSIAQLRAINEKSGTKVYRTSETNEKRGRITGTMEDSDGLKKKNKKNVEVKKKFLSVDERPETGLLESNVADKVDIPKTEILNDNESGLLGDPNETENLELSKGMLAKADNRGKKLNMIDDIIIIHTEEVIE